MTSWRFDQGRLEYLQFDEIRRVARALADIDGIPKPSDENDLLRQKLASLSSLPFFPLNYTVWRNYKRVFGSQMLAAEVAGRIVCTELCRTIANAPNDLDVDDYFSHFIRHFYYPSPIFEGYDPAARQVFPGIAIVKFLLSEYLNRGRLEVSIDDIGNYLIANDVTGLEPLIFFSSLSERAFGGDLRQVRELVKFISQFSFLKWRQPNLYLELASREDALRVEQMLVPHISPRVHNPGAAVLEMGAGFNPAAVFPTSSGQINPMDLEFVEGGKARVTHLRTERSAKLKEFFFANVSDPHVCDMCSMDTRMKYPWVDRLIELHHLLPLSSPVRVEASTTSIKDVVGICPSCHRATHKYYSGWLIRNVLRDFRTYEEARLVYDAAKQEVSNLWI